MNSSQFKYSWFASFGIVLLLFIIVNLVFFPLINFGDDAFIMYSLAGGFGDAPTNLLHYDHIWHPVLGWLFASLFRNFPGINWYTLILLLFQCIACATILHVFFRRFSPSRAILFFLALFGIVEIQAILSLNFTFTAWILAASGFLFFLDSITAANPGKKHKIIFVLLLLLLSGLLRLQILVAVSILFIPVFMSERGVRLRQWLPWVVGILALIFIFNIGQKQYYRTHIPGWGKEEKFRQSLFYAYNRPVRMQKDWKTIFKDSTERAFYWHLFFYDTNFVSQARLNKIGKETTRFRNFTEKDDWQSLYWLFIGWRIYLLLFAVCFFLLWQRGILVLTLRRWWFPAVVILGFYFYLYIFLKLTEPIHSGTILLLLITLAWTIPGVNSRANELSSNPLIRLSLLLLLFPLTWQGLRIWKKDRLNRENHVQFEQMASGLKKHPGKVFVATDDATRLGYFYIWDTPGKNKIDNLIFKDRMLTNTYSGTLQRFGIKQDMMMAIVENPRVYLLGREFPEIVNYYKQRYNLQVLVSPPLPLFDYTEVRKATIANRDSVLSK